jgi:hypothetical protein
MDDNANFFVAYKNSSNEVWYQYLNNPFFYPERLAFDGAIFLIVGKYFGIGDTLWITGVFHINGAIQGYSRNTFMPTAIEMTETVENQTVRLFLTGESEDDNFLFRETMNIDFSNSTIISVSIRTNCGSVIRANDQIVVVSCPDYRNAPFSVFTTNLVHLKTIEGTVNKQIFDFQINLTFK